MQTQFTLPTLQNNYEYDNERPLPTLRKTRMCTNNNISPQWEKKNEYWGSVEKGRSVGTVMRGNGMSSSARPYGSAFTSSVSSFPSLGSGCTSDSTGSGYIKTGPLSRFDSEKKEKGEENETEKENQTEKENEMEKEKSVDERDEVEKLKVENEMLESEKRDLLDHIKEQKNMVSIKSKEVKSEAEILQLREDVKNAKEKLKDDSQKKLLNELTQTNQKLKKQIDNLKYRKFTLTKQLQTPQSGVDIEFTLLKEELDELNEANKESINHFNEKIEQEKKYYAQLHNKSVQLQSKIDSLKSTIESSRSICNIKRNKKSLEKEVKEIREKNAASINYYRLKLQQQMVATATLIDKNNALGAILADLTPKANKIRKAIRFLENSIHQTYQEKERLMYYYQEEYERTQYQLEESKKKFHQQEMRQYTLRERLKELMSFIHDSELLKEVLAEELKQLESIVIDHPLPDSLQDHSDYLNSPQSESHNDGVILSPISAVKSLESKNTVKRDSTILNDNNTIETELINDDLDYSSNNLNQKRDKHNGEMKEFTMQETDEETDVHEIDEVTNVQETDVKEIDEETNVQETDEETDVHEIDEETNVQETDKETDVQETDKETDVHEIDEETNVQETDLHDQKDLVEETDVHDQREIQALSSTQDNWKIPWTSNEFVGSEDKIIASSDSSQLGNERIRKRQTNKNNPRKRNKKVFKAPPVPQSSRWNPNATSLIIAVTPLMLVLFLLLMYL